MTEQHTLDTTISFADIDWDVTINGEFSYGIENYGEDADGNRGEKRGYCDLECGMEVDLHILKLVSQPVTDLAHPKFITACEDALTESFRELLEGRQA
jgi:hypothetical protein